CLWCGDRGTPDRHALSLHDALPIYGRDTQIDDTDLALTVRSQRFKLVRPRANRREIERVAGKLGRVRTLQRVSGQNADAERVEETAQPLRQPEAHQMAAQLFGFDRTPEFSQLLRPRKIRRAQDRHRVDDVVGGEGDAVL